ncbi:MAG: hypothetical protein HQL32_17125 [Planctomycetes bacterium]|nr:hypothetical protein [Planctomycetota bacterium]
MIIPPEQSSFFLTLYKKILSACSEHEPESYEEYVYARNELYSDPEYLSELVNHNAKSPANIKSLIKSISLAKFQKYLYLKTLKKHSIFIAIDSQEVFCVLGLTDSLEDIIPYKYAIVETALLNYQNSIVCDGLISTIPIKLGPNMRKDYNAIYRESKMSKQLITSIVGGY